MVIVFREREEAALIRHKLRKPTSALTIKLFPTPQASEAWGNRLCFRNTLKSPVPAQVVSDLVAIEADISTCFPIWACVCISVHGGTAGRRSFQLSISVEGREQAGYMLYVRRHGGSSYGVNIGQTYTMLRHQPRAYSFI